jgi:hypothetical protein
MQLVSCMFFLSTCVEDIGEPKTEIDGRKAQIKLPEQVRHCLTANTLIFVAQASFYNAMTP